MSELPATLFGVPRGLDQEELAEIEDFLRGAWEAQYRQPPSALSADLDRMKDVFKTGASAKRIRKMVNDLEASGRVPRSVPPELFVPIDDRHGFVTPEGRVILDELARLRTDDQRVLSRDSMVRAADFVARAYGTWQREWLRQQLGATSLRPGTYGVVVFLLLNGSSSREAALRLPADEEEERLLAKVVLPVIDAFATQLGGKQISDRESARLRSNWRLTEARRHLFQHVRSDEHDGDAFVWIDDEDATIRLLSDRLAARRDLDASTLTAALAAALEAYSSARPSLVTWGLSHERTNHSNDVMRRIESGFLDKRSRT